MNSPQPGTRKSCCYLMDRLAGEVTLPLKYNPVLREHKLLAVGSTIDGYVISHCPWCGKKLPTSLRTLFFDLLEREYNIDRPFSSDQEAMIPEEFQSDAWWKKRGL